jgi:hypothetical protein
VVLALLAEIKTASDALLPTPMNAKNAITTITLNKENVFQLAVKDFTPMLRETVSPAPKNAKSALTTDAYNAITTKLSSITISA